MKHRKYIYILSKMDFAMEKLKKFLETQIKTYSKPNYIEMTFGREIGENIFKTIYQDNNEIEFINLIKPFRNYKLSYSQGKEYKLNNLVLRTYNNKYNQISKLSTLETVVISFPEYQLQVCNIDMVSVEEFPLTKDYNQEELFEEVNIHLNPESHDQLLIFQKKGDYHCLKIQLLLDVNLPYKHLDNLVEGVEKILELLGEMDFKM